MFFNLFYLPLVLFFLPYGLYRRWRFGKYRESMPAMLGFRLKEHNPADYAEGCVWMHAVSVGETVAAKAMLPEIRRLFPGMKLVISTTTETGQAQARRMFADEAAAIIYYPLDWLGNVRRFHDVFQPRAVILLEAEIWPNFLNECRRRDCPVVLVNGRVSDRSFRRYHTVRRFLRGALDAIRVFCMQTPADGERMAKLCGRPDAVHVTGNIKFDSLPDPLTSEAKAALAAELGWSTGESTKSNGAVVFGSTHPGEEEIALGLLNKLREAGRREALILCPRHPERFDEVAAMLSDHKMPDGSAPTFVRSSRIDSGQGGQPGAAVSNGSAPDIVLIDRLGVLARAFGLGEVAILGGSFAPIGGHNVLEPAVHGIPVLYGPHMRAQRELVRLMKEGDAHLQVEAEELPARVLGYLEDAASAEAAGQRARTVAEKNRGAARRCGDLIAGALNLEVAPPPESAPEGAAPAETALSQ